MSKNTPIPHFSQDPRREYGIKCSVIASYAKEEVPPLKFIEEALPSLVVVVFEGGWNGKKVQKWTREQLEESFPILAERCDCYVCYAEYFRGWYKEATMKQIHAFVVDVDKVSPEALDWFLNRIMPKFAVKPTYVFASGEGTQFIYLLKEPLEVRKRNKTSIKELYRRLQLKHWALASRGAKIDVHGLTQAFRLPGTRTKLKIQSRVFRTGDPVPVERLEAWLKVSVSKEKEVKKPKPKKKIPDNVFVMPRVKHGRKFYDYCFARALDETEPGHRYLSMFALSVVAWKCQVPREELEKDLYALMDAWNWKYRHVHPVEESEIKKAIRGYNPKATLVRSETLEEWFGWEFEKPTMTKREQVLKCWKAAGDAKRRKLKYERMQAVVKLRKQGLSWTEIARKLGMSRRRAIQLHQEASTS